MRASRPASHDVLHVQQAKARATAVDGVLGAAISSGSAALPASADMCPCSALAHDTRNTLRNRFASGEPLLALRLMVSRSQRTSVCRPGAASSTRRGRGRVTCRPLGARHVYMWRHTPAQREVCPRAPCFAGKVIITVYVNQKTYSHMCQTAKIGILPELYKNKDKRLPAGTKYM